MKSSEEVWSVLTEYQNEKWKLVRFDYEEMRHGREAYNQNMIAQIDVAIKTLEWVLDLYNARLP
jgi:elongation factor P hydroxylase